MQKETMIVYKKLKESYDSNIALLEKLLDNRILSVSIFFQGDEKNTLNGFSHQLLFSKPELVPVLLNKFLEDYVVLLKAERTLVIHEMNRIAAGPMVHEA